MGSGTLPHHAQSMPTTPTPLENSQKSHRGSSLSGTSNRAQAATIRGVERRQQQNGSFSFDLFSVHKSRLICHL